MVVKHVLERQSAGLVRDGKKRLLVCTLVLLAWTGLGVGCSDDTNENLDCVSGELACDGLCVNVGNDPNNCGQCGAFCDENQICADGRCSAGVPNQPATRLR